MAKKFLRHGNRLAARVRRRYFSEGEKRRPEMRLRFAGYKSPGSVGFLGGKERVTIPLTEEHYSLEAFKKHIVALAGLKNEAEKRGLGSSIEIKICRLAKTAGGSKAFTINTQALWDLERTRFGNSSVLQGRYFC